MKLIDFIKANRREIDEIINSPYKNDEERKKKRRSKLRYCARCGVTNEEAEFYTELDNKGSNEWLCQDCAAKDEM